MLTINRPPAPDKPGAGQAGGQTPGERQTVVKVPALSASRSEQLLLFGRNFIKHPKMLGSLIPSSRFLVNKVLGEVDWARGRVFLEYGPGVGTFTTEILRRMRSDAVLVVLETNIDFVRFLKAKVKDERFHVVHGSASEADTVLAQLQLTHADYVISGIPYTTMPADVRDLILQKTSAVLHPNGSFLVYQFTRAVLPYLRQVFGMVRQDFEPLNVMPARLFYCQHHAERNGPERNGDQANGSGRSTPRRLVAHERTGYARPPLSSD